MSSVTKRAPVQSAGVERADLTQLVLLAVGFGCLVGYTRMVSLGFVGYLSQGVIESVDEWYALRSAVSLGMLVVLALSGWFRWFKAGPVGVLVTGAAAVAAPVVFAVDAVGALGPVVPAGRRCGCEGVRGAHMPYVSHCYCRPYTEKWPYNLYTMVHAKTREGLDEFVEQMEQMSGLSARVLVSTKEYKKSLPVYFAGVDE